MGRTLRYGMHMKVLSYPPKHPRNTTLSFNETHWASSEPTYGFKKNDRMLLGVTRRWVSAFIYLSQTKSIKGVASDKIAIYLGPQILYGRQRERQTDSESNGLRFKPRTTMADHCLSVCLSVCLSGRNLTLYPSPRPARPPPCSGTKARCGAQRANRNRRRAGPPRRRPSARVCALWCVERTRG